jgi:phosphonate transport system substrate-binding protein
MKIWRWIGGLWLAFCCLGAASGLAAEETLPPLRLGILPYNSTLALIKTHQPLRQHLQAKLGRQVELFTAPDYLSFLRENLAASYDIMITPPHFGMLAIDKGYVPLLHYTTRLEPLLVLRSGDKLASLDALRGKKIAMAQRFSFVAIIAMRILADKGLQVGRDYQLVEKPTHGAAIAAVALGEVEVAVTTNTLLGQVPPDIRERVQGLSMGIRLPHVLTMVHKRLGAAEIARVKAALLSFPASPEGQAFFHETGYQGYEEVSRDEIKAFQPYVTILKQMLEKSE